MPLGAVIVLIVAAAFFGLVIGCLLTDDDQPAAQPCPACERRAAMDKARADALRTAGFRPSPKE